MNGNELKRFDEDLNRHMENEIENDYDKAVSKRGCNWKQFSNKVFFHIENYTIPQYGDSPNDNVEEWTAEECFKQVDRYMKRRNSNQREGQKKLDILKAAHYLSLGYEKL